MEKEKAVVYARVSTDHDNQIHSFKSQQDYYSEYAYNKGYDLIKIYADEGLTATSANRKAFLEMLHDAGLKYEIEDGLVTVKQDKERDPKFSWIILKDVSRFARNLNAIEIARRLREKGVYIEFENMSFTTKDDDWEFRLGLFLTFTQQESIDRSIKGKKAYNIRSEKGVFHMSNILLGYQRNSDTKEYEVNEDEAVIIREMFDLYISGKKGTTQIADVLNDKEYTTKKGKAFNGGIVLRMLKNEKYKGTVITKKYTHTDITGNHRRIKLPESEWFTHDNAIPAIVSPETFDKAQKLMKERVQITGGGLKGTKLPDNIFHNKIFCGKCGSDYVRMSALKQRKNMTEKIREYFYGCRNRRNQKRRSTVKCDNKGIGHNVLVRELTKIGKELPHHFVNNQMEDEKKALDTILIDLDNKLKYGLEEKDNIREQIKELDTQIENVTSTIASGVTESTQKILVDKIDKIEAKRTELNQKLLSYDTISIENQKQEYINKYYEIEKFSKKEEFTFEEVLEVLHRIDVLEHRKALVEIKTPTLQDDIYKGETDNALLPFSFNLS